MDTSHCEPDPPIADDEVMAIAVCLESLLTLEPGARVRVLHYLIRRLGIRIMDLQ